MSLAPNKRMDGSEGSPSAARGAQHTIGDTARRGGAAAEDRPKDSQGLIARILAPFRRQSGPAPETAGASAARPPARPRIGMANLREMRVEDVMIPRAEIVAVPVTISKADLAKVFAETGLTRLPVYQGTLDNPLGFVHLKDFALRHGLNGSGGRFNLRAMLRPLLYVPPSMPIGVLLAKMQAERCHMALVIDEYGGVDGLVTIEDLIEQVLGEIEDEHDIEEDVLWTRDADGSWIVDARAPIDEFQDALGVDLIASAGVDPEEVETIGGLVFMLAGHVPARGEVVCHPAGFEFEVMDADPRRIKRLRVSPPQPAAAEDRAG